MKIRKIKNKDYYLFDNETEFQEWYPKQVLHHDWRTAKSEEWVLCDDGQVCQVLKRGALKEAMCMLITLEPVSYTHLRAHET